MWNNIQNTGSLCYSNPTLNQNVFKNSLHSPTTLSKTLLFRYQNQRESLLISVPAGKIKKVSPNKESKKITKETQRCFKFLHSVIISAMPQMKSTMPGISLLRFANKPTTLSLEIIKKSVHIQICIYINTDSAIHNNSQLIARSIFSCVRP